MLSGTHGLSPIFTLLGPLPDAADRAGVAVEFLAAGGGERVNFSAACLLYTNERFILQLLKGRIDAAGAGLVHAARAFAKFLH